MIIKLLFEKWIFKPNERRLQQQEKPFAISDKWEPNAHGLGEHMIFVNSIINLN